MNSDHSSKDEKRRWSYKLVAQESGNAIPPIRKYIGLGLISAFLILAVGTSSLTDFFTQPSGNDMVEDMIVAAGGVDNWNQITDGQFLRTKNMYDNTGALLSSVKERFFFKKTEKGTRLKVQLLADNGEITTISQDGEGSWATINDESVDAKTRAQELGMMCASTSCQPLCAASMAFYRFSMPFKLADPGVIPQYNGQANINGEDVQVLDIGFAPEVGRDKWVFMTHPESHLIQKMEYHHYTDKGESHPEEIYWSDHRTVGGITFSHKWTRYHSNGKVLEEYLYSDVDFDTALGDDFFNRPLPGEVSSFYPIISLN